MTTSILTAKLSNIRDALNGFLQRSQGRSPDEQTVTSALNKINNLLNVRQAQQITAQLDRLNRAAGDLKRVTEKINKAINNIKNTDRDLGITAKIVTQVGILADGIVTFNSGQIGTAIDELLKIQGI